MLAFHLSLTAGGIPCLKAIVDRRGGVGIARLLQVWGRMCGEADIRKGLQACMAPLLDPKCHHL